MDDVWISGILTVNKVDIYVVLNSMKRDEMWQINDNIESLSGTQPRFTQNIACIEYFREQYSIWK